MESDLTKKLAAIVTHLQSEFNTIRTGQATPTLLDGIKVQSYGAYMPLNQVANVGIEDARTLRVAPWDTGQVSVIEGAIRDADLGVSLASDSAGVRVIFPDLTAERRVQLSKLAKSKFEDARVAVRGVRDEVMKQLDVQLKAGELSEDERFAGREAAQKEIDSVNQKLEVLFTKKDAELRA